LIKVSQAENNQYDFIICGAGLAGLSLVYRAFSSGTWKNEKVLIIDQAHKNSNDRTWSFWEKSPGVFENLVHHEWNQLIFFNNQGQRIVLDHLPYTYKSIRGIDFYNFTKEYLNGNPQVDWRNESILSAESFDGYCEVTTTTNTFRSRFVINSLFEKPALKASDQYLLQHFKGVTIRTNDKQFNHDEAFLMDFRTSQENGTTFFYTLPIDQQTIFIEYTLFSKELLPKQIYDDKIKEYIKQVLGLPSYEILESEYGVIPMTDFAFNRRNGNILNLGTAGGDTRGSTGYTFTNLQKTVTKILASYSSTGSPFFGQESLALKEKLYDATLLNVLNEGKYPGHLLFGDLFKGTKARAVFSFLDAESTILEELQVMKSLKTWPFLKWFIKVLTKKL